MDKYTLYKRIIIEISKHVNGLLIEEKKPRKQGFL